MLRVVFGERFLDDQRTRRRVTPATDTPIATNAAAQTTNCPVGAPVRPTGTGLRAGGTTDPLVDVPVPAVVTGDRDSTSVVLVVELEAGGTVVLVVLDAGGTVVLVVGGATVVAVLDVGGTVVLVVLDVGGTVVVVVDVVGGTVVLVVLVVGGTVVVVVDVVGGGAAHRSRTTRIRSTWIEFGDSLNPYSEACRITSSPPVRTVPLPPNEPVTSPLYQFVGAPSPTLSGTSADSPPIRVPPIEIPTDSCCWSAVARFGICPSGYRS